MEMGFKWDFAYEILPQMLWATLNTIIAAGVGYAIALIVGLFFLLFLLISIFIKGKLFKGDNNENKKS